MRSRNDRNDSKVIQNLTVNVSGTYHDYGRRVRRSVTDVSLKKKGFYNGTLLGCLSYHLDGPTLCLDCVKVKFFDFLRSFRTKDNPYILTANALIISDKRILTMKRNSEVYGYKNYWDVPASLVLANQDLASRLKERIAAETNIPARLLCGRDTPFTFAAEKPFLHLYYKFSIRGNSKRFLSSTSSPNTLAMLRRDSFQEFCNTKKFFAPAKRMIESYFTRTA